MCDIVCVPVPGLQCVHTLGLCLYLAVDDPRVRVGKECEGEGESKRGMEWEGWMGYKGVGGL